MRRFARVLGAAAAALLATGAPAVAAPFGATLGISAWSLLLGNLFVTGAGSGTSLPALVTVPGSVFAGSDFTSPNRPSLKAFRLEVTGNGPGSFSGTALNGALPLRGEFRFEGLRVYNALHLGTTLLEVPLSIPVTYGYLGFGVGGSVTLPAAGQSQASWHVVHQSWGLGPRTVTVPYVYSFHVPAGMEPSMVHRTIVYYTTMFTGTDSRTPGGAGQVTLVSPTKVLYTVGGSPVRNGHFILAGTLTLNFVPEPGTLVLLGAGAVGLGLAGRARRRS